MNKVSVVIPVLNGGDLLLAVLGMVLSQKCNFNYDVLVIDSGSSDFALKRVKALAESNKLKLIEIPKNEFGHGKTRNLGVESTSSEYVAFLTQDALPIDKNWLENLIKPMDECNEVAGVFGRHYAYPSSGWKMIQDLESFMIGFDRESAVVKITDKLKYDESLSLRQFMHFYSDNNSCLRRSVWEKIPYRNVNYGEDQIWAKEIIEAGYSKAYARDAGVYHSHTYNLRQTFERARVDRKFWVEHFKYVSVRSIADVMLESKNQYIASCLWYEKENIKLNILNRIEIFLKHFANFYGELCGFKDAQMKKQN